MPYVPELRYPSSLQAIWVSEIVHPLVLAAVHF